ncbi:MAG: NifU family protein [Zetaproteobacteria bacterium]|nr:NifU family protein [Zetaproteobacteria bacterium]
MSEIVNNDDGSDQNLAPTNGLIARIQEVIVNDINPYLEMHAGGCELLDVEDGIVTIRLYGGCSGCPSSQITLFNGITPILKEKVPEVEDVILG